MKYIQIGINLTDDLGIKSVSIDHNDTLIPSDSKLIFKIGEALIRSVIQNKESVAIQDILNDLNIERQP